MAAQVLAPAGNIVACDAGPVFNVDKSWRIAHNNNGDKMNTVEIKLNIDEAILISLKKRKAAFQEMLLFYAALSLYKKGKLSLGKSAQLAGMQRIDFIRKLQEEGEAVFDYEDEIVDQMIDSAKEAGI